MQPADSALRTIQAARHDRVAIGIGIEYALGAHIDTDSAGLAPSTVDDDRIGSFCRFLLFFNFAHLYLLPFLEETFFLGFPFFATFLTAFFATFLGAALFVGLAVLRAAFAFSLA
jgi:hypothetical protein